VGGDADSKIEAFGFLFVRLRTDPTELAVGRNDLKASLPRSCAQGLGHECPTDTVINRHCVGQPARAGKIASAFLGRQLRTRLYHSGKVVPIRAITEECEGGARSEYMAA
jgi:hypothetical protein